VNDYVWDWSTYVKLKGKRLTFEDKDDTTPNQPLIKVFWHQCLAEDEWIQSPQPSPALVNQLLRYHNSTVYFRNGLN